MLNLPKPLKIAYLSPKFWPFSIIIALILISFNGQNAFIKPFYESDLTARPSKLDSPKNTDKIVNETTLNQAGALVTTSFKSIFLSFVTEDILPQTEDGSIIGYSSPIGVVRQISVKNYRASKGDTIESIATKFNISPETVRSANPNLKEPIKKNQNITILPISGLLYQIKKSDSAESISDAYKVKKDLLEIYNPSLYSNLENGNGLIILPYAEPFQ